MRKKKDMVELSLRLPSEGWKDLTALLMALLGAAPAVADESVQHSAVEENPAFDEEVFRRRESAELRGEDALPAMAELPEQPVQRYRVTLNGDEPLSVPAPAGYGMEAAESASLERAAEHSRDSAEQGGAAEDWERRWERDCRRYDSGFPIR